MQMDMSPNLFGRDGDSRNDVVTEMALLSLCFSKTAVIVDTITKKIERVILPIPETERYTVPLKALLFRLRNR